MKAAWEQPRATRMRRVLAVIDSLEVGGAQRHLLTLAQALRAYEFELTVATCGEQPMAHLFAEAGVPVRTLTAPSIAGRFSSAFTERLIRLAGESFDLIHAHLYASTISAALAVRTTKLPFVVTRHSMSTWQGARERALAGWADRQAGAVIAVARNAMALVPPDARAHLIPNGVQLPTVPTRQQVATAREALGIPAGAYLVSYVARCVADKNPLLFVEAARHALGQCGDARFLLVGDGYLRPTVQARIRELGMAAHFTVTGWRSDGPDLQAIGDVLALTSDSECSPRVILESMAAERPVVATAVGDVPYQVVSGRTGFVVPREDAAGLGAALLALRDPQLRGSFGRAGRKRVEALFTADRMAQRTAAVYASVLGQAKPVVSAGALPPESSPSLGAPWGQLGEYRPLQVTRQSLRGAQ